MTLHFIDWIIIAAYFVISLIIGLWFRKSAGKSLTDYFLGGRKIPWLVAGVSMVATTFAADTPLAITELVNQKGISGNWLWWNMLIGGMLTTFFFARLWRRANVLTEIEFIELRYGGKIATWFRGFKSLYLGLFINTLVIAWVNLALASILQVFFGISGWQLFMYVGIAMLVASLYSSLSGLIGVAITDVFQFVIAIVGAVLLAVFVIGSPEIGGIRHLTELLPEKTLSFFPSVGQMNAGNIGGIFSISIGTFLAYIGIQWWASWYPGAEPGGGGYIAQRMMSTKSEKHSLWATLFFQITHYVVRPWPWILVGLASIVLYPGLPDSEKRLGYVMAIKDYMPVGLKGLMVVALLAAYMSTISTQLNWGASYIVNDFYKRFFVKSEDAKTQKQLVTAGRIVTLLLMGLGLYVTTLVESISGVWKFLLECGAGLGLVLILRWYWWRITVWSEVVGTLSPFIFYGISKLFFQWEFPVSFFFTVGMTTVSWLTVTFLTKPEDDTNLQKFLIRVKPMGWWKKMYLKFQIEQPSNRPLWFLFLSWMSAIIMAYSLLFSSGKFIFGFYMTGFYWLIAATIGFVGLVIGMRHYN